MRKSITLWLFGILISTQTLSQQITKNFYFEKGVSRLNDGEKTKLNNWLDSIAQLNVSNITINSYCDADGSKSYNLNLAEKRNLAIRNLLPDQYQSLVNQSKSVGEIGAENEDESIMKGNRKTEIILNFLKATTPGVNQDLSSLWQELKPRSQSFCIDPTRDTILILKGGSIIRIERFSFQQNDSVITESNECLFLSIDEVLSKKDSYLNSLTTQSNKLTIESAGMLNIEAEFKNEKATLVKDKELLVMLPSQKNSVGNFQMFNGERNIHNNQMNWLADNSPELQNISLNDYFACGGIASRNGGGIYCKLFFCKIKRFLFPKKYNSGKRTYQPKSESLGLNTACGNIQELFKKYGVDNFEDLQYKLNEALMLTKKKKKNSDKNLK